MGQYWQIINVDKRLTSGNWGKFCEFFFGGTGLDSTIIAWLASPVSGEATKKKVFCPQIGPSHVGTWAGDRLACIGDYMDADDLPPGLFTAAERAELDAYIARGDGGSPWKFFLTAYKSAYMSYCDALYHTTALRAHSGVWVLRNLSKKVYVRSDSVAPIGGSRSWRGLFHNPGLGHVLLTRVCWSSDPSSGMPDDTDLTRGAWAGDRFDTVPLEDVEADLEGKGGWKDVSEEMVAELGKIWRDGEES